MGAETRFANKVDEYLKQLKKSGTLWFLNVYGNGVQRAGVPDRICCYKGKFVAIELKREDGKGKESTRQEIERLWITKAGGHAYVISSMEELYQIFKALEGEL